MTARARLRRRRSSCWPASTACRSRRSGRSVASAWSWSSSAAGATGAAEERGSRDRRRARRPRRGPAQRVDARPGPGARLGRARDGGGLTCAASSARSCPEGGATEAASIAALGLFALQHRGQESAGLAVSDGEQLMLYKDLGMISTVLDERRLPSLRGRLAIAHCRYSTTGSTVWENAQPTYPARAAPRARDRPQRQPRQHPRAARPARGRPRAAARHHRHGAADRAPRRRAGRRHRRRAGQGPAARPRRVQPRGARRAAGHRRPRSVRVPAARPRAAAGHCLGRRPGRRPVERRRRGVRLVPLVGDGGPRHPRRRVRARRASPARSSSWSRARRRARSASRRRPRPCASSSSSTSPGPTRTWRAATSTRRAGGWGCSSPRAPGRRGPRDAGAGHRRPGRGRVRRGERAAVPRGMFRNRYAGRTFIQPSPAMRQRGVTIKLNPLREVVRGKRLVVVDDSIVRGTTTKQIVDLLRRAGARRGPRPDQRAADLPPLLLRHRHPGRDRADRRDALRSRDPRVHRRRLARLPLDRRRPRGPRAAVRAVLLRLLRRQLPGARPVRRRTPASSSSKSRWPAAVADRAVGDRR